MAFFPDVPKIKFDGPDSKNNLAFRHYNEGEIVEEDTPEKIFSSPSDPRTRQFLDRLLRAYTVLAPDWRTGEGPLVALAASLTDSRRNVRLSTEAFALSL